VKNDSEITGNQNDRVRGWNDLSRASLGHFNLADKRTYRSEEKMRATLQQNRYSIALAIGASLMLAMAFVYIPAAHAAGSHHMPPWSSASKTTGGGGTASWTLSTGTVKARAPSPSVLSYANVWMSGPSEFLSSGTQYNYNIASGTITGKLTVTNPGSGKFANILVQGWISCPSPGTPNCALGGTKMTLYSKTITSGTFNVNVNIQNLNGITKTLSSSGVYFSVLFVHVEASGTGNSADFSSLSNYGIKNVNGNDTWI
jgi:hypothetical protein